MRPALLLVLLAGCNAYDWFRLTGLQQEGFSNKADILFVIDNSPSMVDEGEALALNFASFIEEFTEEPPARRPSLTEEVERYLEYVTDRTANLNYQVAITSTDAFTHAGQLLGRNPVLGITDRDVPEKFNQNLLCEAACVVGEPSVPVTCPGGGKPSQDNCADSVQGASEEGIEPVFMAMCRAVPNPPEACFQEWYWWPAVPGKRGGRWETRPPNPAEYVDKDGNPLEDVVLDNRPIDYFDEDDVLSNDGWLREGSVVIPIVVTDEGDQSRRILGREGNVDPYPELFAAFGHRMTWAVIGPNLDCNSGGAADWGVERYENIVAQTGGIYLPINVEGGGDCVVAPFDEALTEIGKLLRGLADTFPLATIPVPESIVVTVNGERIREAEVTWDERLGQYVYGDGWHYDAIANAVVLTGSAVPDFNADVKVWYLPAQSVPRDLPF